MKESVSNKHARVSAKAAQPQLLEVTASCVNSLTFVLGTCVLLEPDAPSSCQRQAGVHMGCPL